MRLYTTREYMTSNISFEKKNLTTKIRLYITSEYMSSDISFEKHLTTINHFQSLHNSNVIKSV